MSECRCQEILASGGHGVFVGDNGEISYSRVSIDSEALAVNLPPVNEGNCKMELTKYQEVLAAEEAGSVDIRISDTGVLSYFLVANDIFGYASTHVLDMPAGVSPWHVLQLKKEFGFTGWMAWLETVAEQGVIGVTDKAGFEALKVKVKDFIASLGPVVVVEEDNPMWSTMQWIIKLKQHSVLDYCVDEKPADAENWLDFVLEDNKILCVYFSRDAMADLRRVRRGIPIPKKSDMQLYREGGWSAIYDAMREANPAYKPFNPAQ